MIHNKKSTYQDFSDEQLFELLKRDSKVAFEEIYRRYFKTLFSHAYKKLGSKEEAQDIIQELFSLVWTKRKNFIKTKNHGGLLYTILKNRILDYYGRKKTRSKYLESLQEFRDCFCSKTDYPIREKELNAVITKQINALPPKMKTVFELSRTDNFSHREIANILNISEQTVSKQITNALKILKKNLGIPVSLLFILLF